MTIFSRMKNLSALMRALTLAAVAAAQAVAAAPAPSDLRTDTCADNSIRQETAEESGRAVRVRRIRVTDYGAVPDSGAAANGAFARALEACGGHDAVIIFPRGRYDFHPDPDSEQTIAMALRGARNIVVDGGGSEFVFHGRMKVFHVEDCENVTLRNFSTDWDRPYISQGEFVAVTPQYVDLRIDRSQYPYVIEQGHIRFTGEGWSAGVVDSYMNIYDKATGTIAYRTRDSHTGNIFNGEAEQVAPDVVRFHGSILEREVPVRPGQIITLYHGTYILTGIELCYSRNITLEDITLYHTLSNGVYGYRCENITLHRVSTTPRTEKGRVFSTVADASHFTCCRGRILIDGCAHAGQGDDFMNVRGTYSRIESFKDRRTALIDGRGWTIGATDTLWVVDRETMRRGAELVVRCINKRNGGYEVEFTDAVPAEVTEGMFLENKTWTPELVVRNCRFEKKNRARGMLVTTPRRVVIENNYFNTAGAAILIEGDLDHWFESGSHTDLTIRNNRFVNCCTSGCETGDRWEWGEAPITISPSFRPDSPDSPAYHRNITICDNTFECFDAPVLFARSVENLRFERNRLKPTFDYEPFLWQRSTLRLDGCRRVTVRDNRVAKDFPARTIELHHMRRSDLAVSDNRVPFTVEMCGE